MIAFYFVIIGAVLVILKLFGMITISWGWATLGLWIWPALIVLIVLFVCVTGTLLTLTRALLEGAERWQRRQRKWHAERRASRSARK